MATKKAKKKATKKTTKKVSKSKTKKAYTTEDLKRSLWATANKLRMNMDAAEYKHVVLGLIFLKYVSDSFDEFRSKLRKQLNDPEHENYFEDASEADIEEELEDRDYYKANNVFWVPIEARWFSNPVTGYRGIQDQAKQATIGKIIDDAMVAIEKENPKLKNVLPKDFARRQPNIRLGELVDLISTIGFNDSEIDSKDVLGQVYEYFLGEFASAEGKKGGQFYTPKSVVNLIVECLEPYQGRVYDPAMGSGGFFVSSEKFIEMHTDKKHVKEAKRKISLYGQESNPTTWRLAAMNMAIRGMDFNFGKEPADTFSKNQHPDLKADFIMANPPFNISDWGGDKLEGDRRWKYGTPPKTNANFAWLQHMIYHMGPRGYSGIVLANGSMTSKSGTEGIIRENLVKSDLVDCMILLPSQLFFNTQIPACIWILSKCKDGSDGKRNRKNEILFIDASGLGRLINRTQKSLSMSELNKISSVYHSWRNLNETYEDNPGFCKAVQVEKVKENDYTLLPGVYIDTKVNSDKNMKGQKNYEDALSEVECLLKQSSESTKSLLNMLRNIQLKDLKDS